MTEIADEWQQAWSAHSFTPDLPHPNMEQKIREALAPFIRQNGTILDLGAGSGNMRYLPKNFDPRLIHAVDVSQEALAMNPAGIKTRADILEPLKDQKTYDLVMSMFVLSSFPPEQQLQIIRNGLQAVKPGGSMIHVDFRNQAALVVPMHPFETQTLARRLRESGINNKILTKNIYPESYDDEDFTHYSALDMLALNKSPQMITSTIQPVQAPHPYS